MASLVLFTSFFLLVCMHSSRARLLPAIDKPSSAKSLHVSISLQVAEKHGEDEMVERTRTATSFSNLLEGSDIVESSSSNHVALLKGKHLKDPKEPTVSPYHGKEEVTNRKNHDNIVVTDYQAPHRKTPIHNK